MVIKCTTVTYVLIHWLVNFCAMFFKSGDELLIGFTDNYLKIPFHLIASL